MRNWITVTETCPRTWYTFIIDPVLIYIINFSCRPVCGRYEKLVTGTETRPRTGYTVASDPVLVYIIIFSSEQLYVCKNIIIYTRTGSVVVCTLSTLIQQWPQRQKVNMFAAGFWVGGDERYMTYQMRQNGTPRCSDARWAEHQSSASGIRRSQLMYSLALIQFSYTQLYFHSTPYMKN